MITRSIINVKKQNYLVAISKTSLYHILMHKKLIFIVGIVFILLSSLLITAVIFQGVFKPQNIVPSHAEEGWLAIEENDSRFEYNTQCWQTCQTGPGSGANYSPRGGYCKTTPTTTSCKDFSGKATLNMNGKGIKFDKIRVGYLTGLNRGSKDVYIDGVKVASINTNSSTWKLESSQNTPWESSALSCAEHKIEISGGSKIGSQGTFFTLDYIDVHQCSTSSNNTTVSTNCQGNGNASAKCFDCYKDSTGDQINMLDYACFVKYYGQNVGK